MLRTVSIFAASVSLAFVLINVVCYDGIPENVPVIRGVTAGKTLFLATRILLINITTLGLCHWLIRILIRNGTAENIEKPGTALLFMALLKMVIEFIGMFNQKIMYNSVYFLAPILLLGCLIIYRNGKYLFKRDYWKTIATNKSDLWIAAGLIVAYAMLNIPVLINMKTK